jgi:hypothetical protein
MERTSSPLPHTQNIACPHACEVGEGVYIMNVYGDFVGAYKSYQLTTNIFSCSSLLNDNILEDYYSCWCFDIFRNYL